jgi:membrane protease YdiL (CAAX protease family)
LPINIAGQPDDSSKLEAFTESQITARGPGCCWDYTDICAFLICVVMFGSLLQLAILFHVLSPLALQQPTVVLQGVVLVWVLLALYATLKFRHGGAVWRALGWTLPSRRHLLVAPLGGFVWAWVVILAVKSTSPTPFPHISLELLALAATLGPVVEESFFRGFLLPIIARNSGAPAAVILTAIVFAIFHQPPTLLHCACFAVSGILYGWVRVVSGSTTAAALMHSVYNLTLFACQRM